jgi:hypothetical protein
MAVIAFIIPSLGISAERSRKKCAEGTKKIAAVRKPKIEIPKWQGYQPLANYELSETLLALKLKIFSSATEGDRTGIFVVFKKNRTSERFIRSFEGSDAFVFTPIAEDSSGTLYKMITFGELSTLGAVLQRHWNESKVKGIKTIVFISTRKPRLKKQKGGWVPG